MEIATNNYSALIEALEDLCLSNEQLPDLAPHDNLSAITLMNAMLEHLEKVWTLLRANELGKLADAWEQGVRDNLVQSMRRREDQISIGEQRTLITSALRKAGYQLPMAGPKDSSMQKAMDASEVFFRTMCEVGNTASDADWISAFKRHYSEKFVSERDDYETVRKSITRYKNSLQVNPLIRFDPDSMRFQVVEFDESAHGLTRARGRPKSKL